MLLEQCRPLNGGGCVRARFVVALQNWPLGGLMAPGALERRPGRLAGDKSGLLCRGWATSFAIEPKLASFSCPPLRPHLLVSSISVLWESLIYTSKAVSKKVRRREATVAR
jgi:hypothetical protein